MCTGGVGWLQQRITGRLPQSARQLSAVLQDDLGGDDSQVDGQQLVALHHLALVTLTVVSQQLSPGQMTSCSQLHVIWINRMAAPQMFTCSNPRRASRWGQSHQEGRVCPRPLI